MELQLDPSLVQIYQEKQRKLIGKNAEKKNMLRTESEQEEATISEDTLESVRTTMGVESEKYTSVNDFNRRDRNLSNRSTIRVRLNNLGYAAILINPNYLISRNMITAIHDNTGLLVSNIFIANAKDEKQNEFSQVYAVRSPALVTQDFDTYKFQKIVITKEGKGEYIPKDEAQDGLQIQPDQIKIDLVTGKAINFLSNPNITFRNRYLNSILNAEKSEKNFIYEIQEPIYYSINAANMGDLQFSKNGFNNVSEPPVYAGKVNKEGLFSRRTKNFSKYIVGEDSKYKFLKNDMLIKQINLLHSIQVRGEQQDNLYNIANEKNDTIIRILIRAAPYQQIKFKIDVYFTVSDNIVREQKERTREVWTPKPIYSIASSAEKNLQQLVDILVSVNPSYDPNTMLKENFSGQLLRGESFWSKVWNTTKQVFSPVVNSVSNFFKEKAEDVVKAAIAPRRSELVMEVKNEEKKNEDVEKKEEAN